MGKIVLKTIIVIIVSFNISFCFKMMTTRVKYEKQFQWTVGNLDELPEVLESMPFYPIENNPSKWIMGFNSGSSKYYRAFMEIYLKSLDFKDIISQRQDIKVNGTITFRNSTHHSIAEKIFKESVITPSVQVTLLRANIGDLFGIHFVSDLFKKLNNILILDFSMTIIAPLTVFTNPV
nr:uncharacterized protein LOC122270140 [Parasteatoda tepidariorum]